VAAPTHGRSAEADSKAAPGAAAVSRTRGRTSQVWSEIRYAVIKTLAELRLTVQPRSSRSRAASIELAGIKASRRL
jgi:hypothetical protein